MMNASNISLGFDREYNYFGEEAWDRASVLTLSSPMDRSTVKDYTLFESILHHQLANKVGLSDLSTCKVLFSESNLTDSKQRARLTELLFETFDAYSLHVAPAPFLSALSSAQKSAVVLECGHGSTTVFPVIDGFIILGFNLHFGS